MLELEQDEILLSQPIVWLSAIKRCLKFGEIPLKYLNRNIFINKKN